MPTASDVHILGSCVFKVAKWEGEREKKLESEEEGEKRIYLEIMS